VLIWKGDRESSIIFALKKQEAAKDKLAIENAFSVLASFGRLASLSPQTVARSCLAKYKHGNTTLSL
jgi:hypothetical protein